MKKITLVQFVTILVVAMFVLPHAAKAAGFPARPVELVCPSSPGGSTDLTMRAVVAVAEQYLGQPIIPRIRSGGGGTIGANFVAKSKPDGYTIIMSGTAPVLIKPLMQELPYERGDLVPIARLTASSMSIIVRSDSPWKTIKDFVEYAKKNPGKVKYASTGPFSQQHLIFEYLSKAEGLELIHVPTGGGGPAFTMMLGGHVDATFMTPSVIAPHVAAGTVRVLGVDNPTRFDFPALKDAPTLKEQGYSFTVPMFNAVFGPKGMSQPVYEKLVTTMKQITEDKSFQRLMGRMSEVVNYMSGADFQKYLDQQAIAIRTAAKYIKVK